MKKVVLAILVVTIIGAMCFAAVACVKNEPTVVTCEELTMLMEGNYYVGTEGTVDLSVALPGSDYSITATNATLDGTTLTVNGAGDFTLVYKPTDTEAENIQADGTVTLKVHAVEGVNVTDWASLSSNVKAGKTVVMQCNITSEGKETVQIKDVSSTIYGNAKELYLNSIMSGTVKNRGNSAFDVVGNGKATFQDVYFYGYKYAEGEQVVLETCEGYGQFINANNDDSSVRPEVTIKHCILENSHKMVYIKGADCTVEGTVMRNGSDALLAAETAGVKGAVLNVKNSVFANSVVCGIILCGWTSANEDSYCTLNLDGFVDIYNWKSRTTAKLMPKTEGEFLYNLVNGLVASELKKPEYNSYFTKGADGEDYVHFGIVVLATGDLKANKSTINGNDGQGIQLVKKNFPLPSAASAIAKTCDLYCIDNNNITIQPTATLDDNKSLSYELIHGRNFK